ncbi:EamA family transporter RarD [Chengkuizengella marina]|uniref:EamA family transporter RarD n=1 Tax=Chengkuizengella marina TaxID=2507566 RepID=A0A6N9Q0L9_9BACL|nr:EamA family transporter RarD [Chengkuizengella marina]NBI28726.1 EamA family transporter RarD [Chengkuizengella marina]
MNTDRNTFFIGTLYSLAAYVLWGLLPIYWKWIEHVPAGEILAHRIAWSFVFVVGIIYLTKKSSSFRQQLYMFWKSPKSMIPVLIAGILISCNWFIYIWAVNHEQMVEASLGYYINPLLSVLLGVIVLREKMSNWQFIALCFAGIGVAILTVEHGQIPLISIALAFSFALYGLVKKIIKLDSLFSLAIETALVLPVALIYLLSLEGKGTGMFVTSSLPTTILLICSGVATALPLLFFAEGLQRISLSLNGFFQYLAPTISLLLAIFVYHEPFSKIQLISFMFIWCGLILFTLSSTNVVKISEKKTASV